MSGVLLTVGNEDSHGDFFLSKYLIRLKNMRLNVFNISRLPDITYILWHRGTYIWYHCLIVCYSTPFFPHFSVYHGVKFNRTMVCKSKVRKLVNDRFKCKNGKNVNKSVNFHFNILIFMDAGLPYHCSQWYIDTSHFL